MDRTFEAKGKTYEVSDEFLYGILQKLAPSAENTGDYAAVYWTLYLGLTTNGIKELS